MHSDEFRNIHTKHGLKDTRLYNIWSKMKGRCNCETGDHYKWYGERGINICDEWNEDFQQFYDWSMNNGYDDSLTLDRIDVNGDYEPSNCRWVTMITQNNNRRNNVLICINGEEKTLRQWYELFDTDLTYEQFRGRYYHRKAKSYDEAIIFLSSFLN